MLGTGIIKGFYITAKNFVGSYLTRQRMTTVEYPETRLKLPETSRTFPFLVYDGDHPIAGLRCTACKICEKECPPQCIYIIPDRDDKGKAMKHPRIFDIDISVCIGCQICVEVCPFDSIKMDQIFEIAVRDRYAPLLLHRGNLAKPNSYYHRISPTAAAEVDARLAAAKSAADDRAKSAAAAKAAAAAKPAATFATPEAATKPAPATQPPTPPPAALETK